MAELLSIRELRIRAEKATQELEFVRSQMARRSALCESYQATLAMTKAAEAVGEAVREAGWADMAMELAELHEKRAVEVLQKD